MISIIIPVYNAEKTIERCIKSVLNQTYHDFEIIVVYKNGSDKTLDILHSIDDLRIKIVYQTVETGPGGARNIGIDFSTGDYLGFVESDDYIHQDFYNKLLSRLIQDSSDIAWGEIVRKEEKKSWIKSGHKLTYENFFEKYQLINNGASFDKLFKSSLIKDHAIRFSENIRFEDNPMILKAFFYSKKISTVTDALYFYNPDPWSDEYKNLLKQHIFPIAEDMMDFAKNNHFTSREISLLQRKIIQSFADSFVYEPDIYYKFSKIIGSPLFLKLRYFRKCIKKFKRSILA